MNTDPGRFGGNERGAPPPEPARRLRLMGREIMLPRSRLLRIVLGVLLILFGIVGFLPVVGFWMIPVGLLVLSYEFAVVRRWRRRLVLWWGKRRTR